MFKKRKVSVVADQLLTPPIEMRDAANNSLDIAAFLRRNKDGTYNRYTGPDIAEAPETMSEPKKGLFAKASSFFRNRYGSDNNFEETPTPESAPETQPKKAGLFSLRRKEKNPAEGDKRRFTLANALSIGAGIATHAIPSSCAKGAATAALCGAWAAAPAAAVLAAGAIAGGATNVATQFIVEWVKEGKKSGNAGAGFKKAHENMKGKYLKKLALGAGLGFVGGGAMAAAEYLELDKLIANLPATQYVMEKLQPVAAMFTGAHAEAASQVDITPTKPELPEVYVQTAASGEEMIPMVKGPIYLDEAMAAEATSQEMPQTVPTKSIPIPVEKPDVPDVHAATALTPAAEEQVMEALDSIPEITKETVASTVIDPSLSPQALKDEALNLLKSGDVQAALDHYQAAADAGNHQAVTDLAYFQYHGLHGIEANPEAALESMKSVAGKNELASAFVDQWTGAKPTDLTPVQQLAAEKAAVVAKHTAQATVQASAEETIVAGPLTESDLRARPPVTSSVIPVATAPLEQLPQTLTGSKIAGEIANCKQQFMNGSVLCQTFAADRYKVQPGQFVTIEGPKGNIYRFGMAEDSTPKSLGKFMREDIVPKYMARFGMR